MKKNFTEATISLFKCIVADSLTLPKSSIQKNLSLTLRRGYMFDTSIHVTQAMIDAANKIVGLSPERMNQTFHKSWATVRDTPMFVLIAQQILHYITTYGFESIGRFDNNTVYIPAEKLEIPDLNLSELKIIFIRRMTAEDVVTEIVKLSQLALSQETLDDIMTVAENISLENVITKIKNRELVTRLNKLYGIVLSEPVEFLRYIINELTGDTLIIKNAALIAKIKKADGQTLDKLMQKAPTNLSSIFLRYKPLFLAMKSISENKTFYNRLRKDANNTHQPLPEDYLNSVTKYLKRNELKLSRLTDALENATIWRKIRLAYALEYRLDNPKSIKYQIRNGKGYATSFEITTKGKHLVSARDIVVESIVNSVRTRVDGKTVYIPNGVHYTLPATEKQFIGYAPTGTYIECDSDALVGIHWFDKEVDKIKGYGNGRVDLDLAVSSVDGKTGWDGRYRSNGNKIMHSGDVTSAPLPNGATEVIYFGRCQDYDGIISLNLYNSYDEMAVEYKFFIASEKVDSLQRNYMVDPNSIVASFRLSVKDRTNTIAAISISNNKTRISLTNSEMEKARTSSWKSYSNHETAYYQHKAEHTILLENILYMAGANIVDEMPEEGEYIDLSPAALTKTTILDLLS